MEREFGDFRFSSGSPSAIERVPDFVLDWRRYFEGRPDLKGHQLKRPEYWNKKLLPELQTVLADVRKTTTCRVIRARGLARLSAWLRSDIHSAKLRDTRLKFNSSRNCGELTLRPLPDFALSLSTGPKVKLSRAVA